MIRFKCAACGKQIGVADTNAGKRVQCAQCRKVFNIPLAGLRGWDAEPPDLDLLGALAATAGPPEVVVPRLPRAGFSFPVLPPALEQLLPTTNRKVLIAAPVAFLGLLYLLIWGLTRDTWERDNLPRLQAMLVQAKRDCNDGCLEQSLTAYSTILSEATACAIPSRKLSKLLEEAKRGLALVRCMWQQQQKERNLRPRLERLWQEAEALAKADRLAEARTSYQAVLDMLPAEEARTTPYLSDIYEKAQQRIAELGASSRR